MPGKKNELSISMCMIVKNEEGLLGSCLSSAAPLVSEIIIVDTGSTDATKKLASSFGAKIYDLPWKNDFSEARNFALKQATCKYILILDADEQVKFDLAALKKFLTTTSSSVFNVQVKDVESGSSAPSVRLWKRSDGIRYKNKIHEQVSHKAETAQDIASGILSISHAGYTAEVMRDKKKLQRNKELLIAELKAEPENELFRYHLANILNIEGNTQGAIAAMEEQMKTFGLHSAVSFRFLASLYGRVREDQKALQIINDGLDIYPDYLDLIYLAANVNLQSGALDAAERLYNACLEAPAASTLNYPGYAGVRGHLPLRGLALAALSRGETEKAIPYLINSALQAGKDRAAFNILMRLIKQIHPDENAREKILAETSKNGLNVADMTKLLDEEI